MVIQVTIDNNKINDYMNTLFLSSIVFLVILRPGRDMRRIQGNHCRNIKAIHRGLKQKDIESPQNVHEGYVNCKLLGTRKQKPTG